MLGLGSKVQKRAFLAYGRGSFSRSAPTAARLFTTSPPSDSYDEFKRSFLAPKEKFHGSKDTSSGAYSNLRNAAAANAHMNNARVPSLDTLSEEVLSVMLDETVRRRDGESLRMLLIEARVLDKISSPLLQHTFESCFVTQEDLKHLSENAKKNHMENASFILQMSLSSSPKGDRKYHIMASSSHCEQLLAWLVDHSKWYQAAITAEYMVNSKYTFTGDREIFFIAAGLMKNSLGVSRVLQLLDQIVKHRRSDLSELFSYTKMNRYSLSMSGTHTNRRELDRAPMKALSSSLLSQMRENSWFSFGASKTLVALACGSAQHDIAIDFVRSAIDIAENINSQSSYRDSATGRISRLAEVLARSLSGSHDSINGSIDIDGDMNIKKSFVNKIDIVSMLRAFSQGAGVASADNKSFTGKSLESPLSQVLIDISARLVLKAQKDRQERNSDAAGVLPLSSEPFLSGISKHNDFIKMYWVLCSRVKGYEGGNHKVQKLSGSSGSSASRMQHGSLEAEAISDSYPRQHYDINSEQDSQEHNIADAYMQKSYNQLTAFMLDSESTVMTSSPAPGYHRRLFRYLCDELGLRHKIVELLKEKTGGMGDTYGVRVWKENSRMRHDKPPSLSDLLHRDYRRNPNLRRFDGHMQHWNIIEDYLISLPHDVLKSVSGVVGAMTSGYPSTEWALLFAQILRENNIAYPNLLLRNMLKMAGNRNDIYGLLEALYANQECICMGINPMNTSSSSDGSIKIKKGGVVISEDGFIYSEDEARAAGLTVLKSISEREEEERMATELHATNDDSSSIVAPFQAVLTGSGKKYVDSDNDKGTGIKGYLTASDWNRTCQAANHTRISELPEPSFREAYTEVMQLMSLSGTELDDGTMRTLLRFLVYTDPDAELGKRIMRRFARDKSLDIQHIECTALTYSLLRNRVKKLPGLDLARPMYKNENYLFVYPAALSHIVDSIAANAEALGGDFLVRFESGWSKAHSEQGRKELYTLLSEYLEPESPMRQNLVEMESDEARRSVVMLSVYVAYLVGTKTNQKRQQHTNNNSNNNHHHHHHQNRDGSPFRRAFDLLYSAESMMADADQLQRDLRKESRIRDDSDSSYLGGESGDDDYYNDDGDEEDYHPR
jgi:hypothetical protein